MQNGGMIYGYARVSTAAQGETGQVRQLKAAGCEKVFREKITGTTGSVVGLVQLGFRRGLMVYRGPRAGQPNRYGPTSGSLSRRPCIRLRFEFDASNGSLAAIASAASANS